MINIYIIFYELLLLIIKETFIKSKNIILNVNRVSFKDFIGEKKLDDFINYDIYTEIKVGTPPQKVTHFIEPNDKIFQFKKKLINYNSNKFNNSIINFFENQFYLFNSSKSSTYKGFFSDYFILDENNNKINLNFTIYDNNRDDKTKYGIIGLHTMYENIEKNSFKELYSFIYQLKQLNIINEYTFYFLYNNDNIFENSINLGKIIIGEYPHQFKENKLYQKEDLIKLYPASNDVWSITCNELVLGDYVENNINLNFHFNAKFIRGSSKFNNQIKSIFFDDLIKQNLCKCEIISENKYIFEYEIYSCNNTEIIRDSIKTFPKLEFVDKIHDIIFSLDYTDLFQFFEEKNLFYFMVIFRTNYLFQTDAWLIGEIFLKKYLFTFNLESKTISYYKTKLNKSENNMINVNKKTNNYLRIFFEVLLVIIIVFCIYLLYRKYKKTRKLLANELEDSNYTYISKENKNENNLVA